MFDGFEKMFPPDGYEVRPAANWTEGDTEALLGSCPRLFTEFVRGGGHPSYGGGLVRFLLPGTSPDLVNWNAPDGWAADWAGWGGRSVVFGFDWLGRLLAFDRERTDAASGEPLLALFDPGFGQYLFLPWTFEALMSREVLASHDAVLASRFYGDWRASGGRELRFDECASYRVPPFLCGADELANLEITHVEVHVSLMGQLFHR